eukprot:12315373-Ditylum_brightwellii.AAC.1
MTGGNTLFVSQFLQSLWDEGLLVYSLEYNTWKWDSVAVVAKELSDDVGALMAEKIRQFPTGCQYTIKLLACLGSKFDESILTLLISKGGELNDEMRTKGKRKRTQSSNHLLL